MTAEMSSQQVEICAALLQRRCVFTSATQVAEQSECDPLQEAGMLVHSFTIGAHFLHWTPSRSSALQWPTNGTVFGMPLFLCIGLVRNKLMRAAGIAFGANTVESTIVALIIALCFHVRPNACAAVPDDTVDSASAMFKSLLSESRKKSPPCRPYPYLLQRFVPTTTHRHVVPTLQQSLDGVALGATFAKAGYSNVKYFWFAAAFVLVRV